MRKISSRAIATGLCITLGVSALAMTGCSNKGDEESKGDSKGTLDTTSGIISTLDKNVEGDVSIMLWAGDSKDYTDIGHMNLDKDSLTSQNVAAVYAVAKKFNETYPNIKINLWAKTGDPDQPNTPSWDQEIDSFKTKNGKYPDIWASTSVVNDIKKGIVADLSQYSEDDSFKVYNETLMGYMNYYGFQAGLPSYTTPHGVWINKSLATENNIEVPDPDWDIDDYTDFATSGDGESFWGSMTIPTNFINTGVTTINKSIVEHNNSSEYYVDITTDSVQNLLRYVPKWVDDSLYAQQGLGNVPVEVAQESLSYEWNYFCNNRLLTLETCPYQMTNAADPDAVGQIGTVSATDWDIYPRPSTDDCENTVGVEFDPICIHNYAADDGDTAWSDDEKQKLLIAYTFATYWTSSTEAKQAIADTQYKSGDTYKSAMNDSFPVVSGDMYDEQMEIWYSIPAHQRYADAEKMPGFQKVVEIFKDGTKTWDYSDKCYPCTITEDGSKKECMYEWNNMWDGNVAGSYQTEKSWLNDVKARLSDWNKNINERFAEAEKQLQDALKKYYGFTDSDFTVEE